MIILLLTDGPSNLVQVLLEQDGANIVITRTTPSLVTEPVPSYDLLVIYNIANSTSASPYVINLMAERKTPVLIGYINYSNSGLGLSANNALGMLYLADAVSDDSSRNTMYVSTSHEIFDGTNLSAGSTFSAYVGSEYITSIGISNLKTYCHVILTKDSSASGRISSVYFPKGTVTPADTLEFDVIYLGFLSNRIESSHFTKVIVKNVLKFLSVYPYIVSGYVYTSSKVGLVRKLFILEQKTGNLLRTVTSDISGYYSTRVRTPDPVIVICTPDSPSKNAQVKYNIIPELTKDDESSTST